MSTRDWIEEENYENRIRGSVQVQGDMEMGTRTSMCRLPVFGSSS